MTPVNLSLTITEEHPAYQWAKKQSDSVSAMGHIGTHIRAIASIQNDRAK